MLDLYFVSVKYVFVKCKACVCLCETFENLKVQIKGVTFAITEKPRVVFAKCVWMGGNFEISEGWFCKRIFLILFPVKKIYTYPKVAFEMCVLKCVKILGKMVKIRVFM
jgi:hypothetical protein